jgi:RNA polymerase sigma factor (sigma-70 family)
MANGQLANAVRQLRRLLGNRPADGQGDGELLGRFVRDGDQAAFTALVERHGPMVLGVCRRVLDDEHEAEDVFQAAYLVLVRKARSLNQYGSLGNWLYCVAYHLALKARTQSARRQAKERQVVDMPEAAAGASSAWAELRPALDAELDRLPAKYRTPVVLCYLEGKTNEEAARELGWPEGTLKFRLAKARDLLRGRLTRRGLTLSSALLAPSLADQASASVPASLREATTQAAALFAAGNTLAIGATSVRAVGMAQGALRAMRISKIKTLFVLFLAVGLAGAGSGVLLSQDTKQDGKFCPVGDSKRDKHPPASPSPITLVVGATKAADEEKPAKNEPPVAVNAGKDVRRRLSQIVTLEIPNTTLSDALKIITEKTRVPIVVDEKAFEAIGVQKPGEAFVELPKMTNVRLSYALKRLLAQIKGDVYTGSFLVRSDHVEVTTTYNVMVAEASSQPVMLSLLKLLPEPKPGLGAPDPLAMEPTVPAELVWNDPTRRQTPLIFVEAEQRPLVDALREAGEEAGYQLLIDPRVAEKSKAPVSLSLERVLFDTAVSLLVEQTDLDWVWVDNIVYVTTKENARQRREREKAHDETRIRLLRETAALKPPAPPAAEPAPPQANVDSSKQPLAGVLDGISRSTGIRVVIDPRVAEKAMTPLTITLQGVPPETAVRLLANMVDLQAVRVDQVYYVTSKENAKAMLEPVTKPKPKSSEP